ncbi:hypothetical protein HanPSC8_Chr06g0245181 [Helianthus annuus]|nr:hypothetical protein HanPSC8_Chr06g0245181 [Helianthus annuus]
MLVTKSLFFLRCKIVNYTKNLSNFHHLLVLDQICHPFTKSIQQINILNLMSILNHNQQRRNPYLFTLNKISQIIPRGCTHFLIARAAF